MKKLKRLSTCKSAMLFLFCTFLILHLSFSVCAKNSTSDLDAYIKFVVPQKNVFEGESVIVDLLFVGSDKDIAGINRVSYPDFNGLEWQEISLSRTMDDTDYSSLTDGKKPVTPIARYLLKLPKEGQFELDPGKIVAEVYLPETYVDPFWGTRYRKKTTRHLPSKRTALKVNSLPEDVKENHFPVGDWKVEWILPPGDIVPGQEGIVILKIEGYGDLRNSDLPDISKAFPESLRFVGMTPEINVVAKNGRIFSSAQLICTFTASEAGDFLLNSLKFPYFSTDGKKKKSVIVNPIEINIQNSKKVNRNLRFEQI